jgi:predicted nuclease with TOPRIM domain
MKIERVFLVFYIIAGFYLIFPISAMSSCVDLDEQIHENRVRFEELEGGKRMFFEELRQTGDVDQKHEIEMRIEEIKQEQNELNQELGRFEDEFAQCRQQLDQNEKKRIAGDRDGLHPGIIAAIIGAIGAVLAALIGLLRRR